MQISPAFYLFYQLSLSALQRYQPSWPIFSALLIVHCSTLVQHTIRYEGCNGSQSSSSDQPGLPSGSQSGQAYFATGPHAPCQKRSLFKGSLQKIWNFFMAFAMKGVGVSRVIAFFFKMFFCKNHLESFPDCQNVFLQIVINFILYTYSSWGDHEYGWIYQ